LADADPVCWVSTEASGDEVANFARGRMGSQGDYGLRVSVVREVQADHRCLSDLIEERLARE
jgi:hypothetical protein